jgi:hypothetical protein|tara:strand:- start:143 stop:343 length:201 start_codon:yes stop_codon:yes gene_type:complete
MILNDEPEWIFPLEWMEAGQSFFIPTLKASSMIYIIDRGAKRAGVKVKIFQTMKDDVMGVRVWRLR